MRIGGEAAEVEFTKNRAVASVFIVRKIAEIANPPLMNIIRLIDEIEQLVEDGKGMLGKRLVEEEAFFSKMHQLRAALPQALKDAESPALPANGCELSRADKLRLIAQWSAELARDEP